MYERFYGLGAPPFELTPDPRYLLLTRQHREALSVLQYGVSRKGLTLLVGEAGTGKTTLIHAAMRESREEDAIAVYLNNPILTRDEFVELLAVGFGLRQEARTSKSRFLLDLHQRLLERRAAGRVTTLIVDEAQCLPCELLEEIRLLANIETESDTLLPIVLSGQPELAQRLNDPALRQLKQRVALRATLAPLDLEETGAYVTNRLRVAGGAETPLFTSTAIETVYRHSSGIPRTISVICDNALVAGFAMRRTTIDSEIVMEVCRELDFLATCEDQVGTTPGAPMELMS
jgi:type II secretory pathway predicted ATPase ExeA